MEAIHIRIDKATKDLIKLYCVKNDTSIKDFVTDAIKEKLTNKQSGNE